MATVIEQETEFEKSLFIFRRDLRLFDNTGLFKALQRSQAVIPCFILDPVQLQPHPYQSPAALTFMKESLEDLMHQLQQHGGRLFVCSGSPDRVVESLIQEVGIDAVFCNKDYTPFSQKRDQGLLDVCERHRIAFCSYHDSLLQPPGRVVKKDGNPYSVFTPFFKCASQITVPLPEKVTQPVFYQKEIHDPCIADLRVLHEVSSFQSPLKGGRSRALDLLGNSKIHLNYSKNRDIPEYSATTKLSPHHKFGTCSIREVYHDFKNALGLQHPLIRQLYWRDFFTHIAYFYPHVFGHAFRLKYDQIEWNGTAEHFDVWCQGKTGFPIVDAGMREMNATGYMHNRLRMITASFLVKDLHVDWRKGERYFAQKLVDYDPCVNNGNWQWAASTGCDAQPYFRIFNPALQQKRFDPQEHYIQKWVPEYHRSNYLKPIVDHKSQSQIAKILFKEI
ncbi:MAG: deoxyribodipyrimidine photo-lyase [SAR324 cluster bacterium]|nr:deoxyribodipyrimidine photo-lyase [SAR324 cluster bacterium]